MLEFMLDELSLATLLLVVPGAVVVAAAAAVAVIVCEGLAPIGGPPMVVVVVGLAPANDPMPIKCELDEVARCVGDFVVAWLPPPIVLGTRAEELL